MAIKTLSSHRRRTVLSGRGHQLLLLMPIAAVDLMFLLWPLVTAIETSFQRGGRGYVEVFTTPFLGLVLQNTVIISVATTAAAVGLAYVCAVVAWTGGERTRIAVFGFVLLPFWTGVLVKNLAWIALFQDNGVISTLTRWLTGSPEGITILHTRAAVVIAMVHYVLPYAFFPIYLSLNAIDERLTKAAESLGATGFHVARRVVLPLSLPGVYAASLLVLIISTGFYITPALLGGPREMMIANLVEFFVHSLADLGAGSALAVLLAVAVLVLVLGYQLVPREGQFGGA